ESFDDVQGMLRHMGGAAAMGAGGVTALGCTIGQGVSGVSTLAMSPPIALASIFAGSVFGLYWLMTGSVREALLMVFGREAK
ncbi:MAG: YeeE/YedE family protein, partial [Alphaproteobacteria bacterium]